MAGIASRFELQKVRSRSLPKRERSSCRFFLRHVLDSLCFVSALLLTSLLPVTIANKSISAAGVPPLLISQETSTRAIALESLCLTSEPFALTSPCAWGSDRRTRIILFAMDLRLQPGEKASVVTADAEDATQRHYDLTVEY